VNPRNLLTTCLVAAAVVVVAASPAVADDGGRVLSTTLTGAAEVPGPGDPDGAGTAVLRVNPGQKEVCYTLTASGIAAAVAAHIHVGTVTQSGPVVVGLVAPATGSSSACAAVSRELAIALIQHPENYYVNVHTSEFPAGAIRGQLD
jgi:hypothetical protein